MIFEIVEIYYCPYCNKLGKVLNGFFSFDQFKQNYSCSVESCKFCGEHFKVIDNFERCNVCDRRVMCLGEPRAIVGSIATIKKMLDDNAYKRNFVIDVVDVAIKDINRIIEKYGRKCLKEIFLTAQRGIYGNR